VWKCLEKKKEDPDMAEGCKAILNAHTRLANFHFSLDYSLAQHCSEDAAQLCAVEVALAEAEPFGNEGAIIGCLIGKREEVKSFPCKAVLMTKAAQRLANIENDPTASRTCGGDVQALCPDVLGEGQGEVHKCLLKHLKNLTVPCREVEMEYAQMATEDIRLAKWMKTECGRARKRFCQGVEEGSGEHVATCMLKNMHHSSMDAGCRQKLVELEELRAKDIRFNPPLAKQCKGDLVNIQMTHPTLPECAPNEDDFFALSGLGIRCLTQHRAEVKGVDCKSALLAVLQQQSNDLRAKPGMVQACRQDIKALCPEVSPGSGRLHQCLRENAKKIGSKACVKMVAEVAEAEKEDALISPRIRKECANEMQVYCSSVEHGDARKFACLRLHSRQPEFSAGCRKELTKLGFNTSAAVAAATIEMAVPEASAVLQKLLHERNFWDKWGRVVIAGGGALLVAVLMGVVAIVVHLRRGRPDYGIEVEQAEKEDP